jgi:hypothetical protein
MYNLTDIPTKDATLVTAEDFEDVTTSGDINQSEPSNIEIINKDQQNQYKEIKDIFDKISKTEK